MNRQFLWLGLLLPALAAGPAGASQSAGASLGPASVFTTDPGDMLTFPSEAYNCLRLVSLEMDSFPFSRDRMSAFAVWNDAPGKIGAIGMAFGDLQGQTEINGLIASLNEALAGHPLMSPRNAIPVPGNRFRLIYAREAGPVIAGLSVGMAAAGREYDFSDTIPQDAVRRRAKSGIWSFDAGVSRIFSDNMYLQTAAGIQSLSFSSYFELSGADPLYWERVENSRGRGGRLDARLFYGINNQIKLISALALNSLQAGYQASYADTLHLPGSLFDRAGGEYHKRRVELSLGTEYQPKPRMKLLAGLVIGSETLEVSDSNNIWLVSTTPARLASRRVGSVILPGLQAGLEAELLDWLTLRLGSSQRVVWVNIRDRYADLSTSESTGQEAEFTASFGLGFRFGNMAIDAQLNQGQPFGIGYLISGMAGAPFARLSMEYRY
jgi:hypothetical protein